MITCHVELEAQPFSDTFVTNTLLNMKLERNLLSFLTFRFISTRSLTLKYLQYFFENINYRIFTHVTRALYSILHTAHPFGVL